MLLAAPFHNEALNSALRLAASAPPEREIRLAAKPVGKTSCLQKSSHCPTGLGPYRKNQDFAAKLDTQNRWLTKIMRNNCANVITLGNLHKMCREPPGREAEAKRTRGTCGR
jgi:hypothetical protein